MTREKRPAASGKSSARRAEFPVARLDELIEEATVDAHDESEQVAGFYTMRSPGSTST